MFTDKIRCFCSRKEEGKAIMKLFMKCLLPKQTLCSIIKETIEKQGVTQSCLKRTGDGVSPVADGVTMGL